MYEISEISPCIYQKKGLRKSLFFCLSIRQYPLVHEHSLQDRCIVC